MLCSGPSISCCSSFAISAFICWIASLHTFNFSFNSLISLPIFWRAAPIEAVVLCSISAPIMQKKTKSQIIEYHAWSINRNSHKTILRMSIQNFYRNENSELLRCNMTECLSWILINPFTHKISLLILMTVCNTLLTIFVLEFSIEPDGNPMIDIFLCCQCLLSRYCIWYCKEKFYLGHLWEWKGKVPCNFNFMPLKKAKQQVNLPYHIYLCWTEHLLKVKPIHKCVLVLNPLTPASDYIYFLLTISPLNHTLPSQE